MSEHDESKKLFDIFPSGWANFTYRNIQVNDISYVCEPLFDMIDAVIGVLTDDKPSVIRFDHEGTDSELAFSVYGLAHIHRGACVFCPMEYGEMLSFAMKLADEAEQDKVAWTEAWYITRQEDEKAYEGYIELIEDTVNELREAIRVAAAYETRPMNYIRKTFRGMETLGVHRKVLV